METFSPKDKVVDIIKEYPTTRILFDEVSHFDDTASVEDFCFKNSIDILSFRRKKAGLLVKRQRQCAVVVC